MLLSNRRASRDAYPEALMSILSMARANDSRACLSCWDRIRPDATPLWDLPDLAACFGVGRLSVKDESVRSPLGSFKALGAPIALVRLIQRLWPGHDLDGKGLFEGRHRAFLSGFTVISATDGNHGRALAAAARSIGCCCVIVLHAHVSAEREQAIAAYGARIVRISGNYDDSVVEAERLARLHGWNVVSDTSYDGYEEIPGDVMQGYGAIAAEVIEQTGAAPSHSAYTHVILQGGVGGLAAGVTSYLWEFHGRDRPLFIVAEPLQADCLYQSALQGKAARAGGSVDSVMAGLACGEASPLAWRVLQSVIDAFITISDEEAVDAMRLLAAGSEHDIPIVAGESGAAGLAALKRLMADGRHSALPELDAGSRILVINTEGATAPAVYRDLVGEDHAFVLARQADWRARFHS